MPNTAISRCCALLPRWSGPWLQWQLSSRRDHFRVCLPLTRRNSSPNMGTCGFLFVVSADSPGFRADQLLSLVGFLPSDSSWPLETPRSFQPHHWTRATRQQTCQPAAARLLLTHPPLPQLRPSCHRRQRRCHRRRQQVMCRICRRLQRTYPCRPQRPIHHHPWRACRHHQQGMRRTCRLPHRVRRRRRPHRAHQQWRRQPHRPDLLRPRWTSAPCPPRQLPRMRKRTTSPGWTSCTIDLRAGRSGRAAWAR